MQYADECNQMKQNTSKAEYNDNEYGRTWLAVLDDLLSLL